MTISERIYEYLEKKALPSLSLLNIHPLIDKMMESEDVEI
jgi:hypothetical protein